VAVDPAGRYAYIPDYYGSTIAQYAIGVAGDLQPLTPATVTTGTNPVSVAIDPSGTHLYVAFMNGVGQFAIGASGGLSPLVPSTLSIGPASGVAVHPSGRSAYVSDGLAGVIDQYAIAADGTLQPLTPASVAGIAPYPLAFDPSGRWAYLPDVTVSQYA